MDKQEWLNQIESLNVSRSNVNEVEMYEKKLLLRRELEAIDEKSLLIIHKIINNILLNWDEAKYRIIAKRKLSEKTIDFLISCNFKIKVIDFEPKLYFHDTDTSSLKEFQNIVKSQILLIENRRKLKLDEAAKYKEEQEHKQKLLGVIRQEMIARSKNTL